MGTQTEELQPREGQETPPPEQAEGPCLLLLLRVVASSVKWGYLGSLGLGDEKCPHRRLLESISRTSPLLVSTRALPLAETAW